MGDTDAALPQHQYLFCIVQFRIMQKKRKIITNCHMKANQERTTRDKFHLLNILHHLPHSVTSSQAMQITGRFVQTEIKPQSI
jgi:hypothetical protein